MKHYTMLLMGFLSHWHHRATAERFRQEDIGRSQPWILDYLAEHDGCIQRELADRAHFDPASITSALVRMEEQGMVERKAVPGDRRALRVFLTEKGREKQRYVQEVLTEAEEIALGGFTEEERRQLHDYLHRIHENFEREDEKRL